ncbi:MAG TPA: glycosyltransferase family 4 protein [Solirubrobacteraceae bacterium]|jgi:glycosyltransferase involved in cell wall biosynthesis|nr:glycosyltransferase family 4 protein [Solirubrobacteraceae bacterium]
MRILIFHGYLLGGTGSNVYNARLAAALVALGHEVHLLCQDRQPERQSFVDAVGDWEEGALRVRVLRWPISDRSVRCTAYRPDIGGLLPVYVMDRYEGIQARPFAQCTEQEVDRYIAANVSAVREVAELVHPELALANHLVMGPVILARALGGQTPYAVKVHGSALEYTVKPNPKRFLGFAREGLAGARAVLVGSRHTAESLWQALDDRDLHKRTRLGPPGVDIARFRPREAPAAAQAVHALAARLRTDASDAARRTGLAARESPGQAGSEGNVDQAGSDGNADEAGSEGNTREASSGSDAFARDDLAAASALERLDPGRDRLVAFVGKLIANKGVDLLLAAWPLLCAREPAARLVVVGFGSERERLLAAAAPLGERVLFTGRLDHEELTELLPACEALVVPSIFPEAFGMVAAEGAACGAFPVSAAHSGLAEVSSTLARYIPAQAAPWLSFAIDDDAVRALADCLIGWLGADTELRTKTRAGLVQAVREQWSWEGVARGVIDAASGELDDLAVP